MNFVNSLIIGSSKILYKSLAFSIKTNKIDSGLLVQEITPGLNLQGFSKSPCKSTYMAFFATGNGKGSSPLPG